MFSSIVYCLVIYMYSGWVSASGDINKINTWKKIKLKNNYVDGVKEIPADFNLKRQLFSAKQTYSLAKASKPSEAYSEQMAKSLMNYLRKEKEGMGKRKYKSSNMCDSFFSCIVIPYKFWTFLRDLGQRDISKLGKFTTRPIEDSYVTSKTKHVSLRTWKVSAYAMRYNDPLWRKQWYVQDYRTRQGPVMDHNVVPVYMMGYTGKGVVVAVVDDGIISGIPDIKDNFDESMSYNFCENKPGCSPPFNQGYKNTHGTKSAAVIAMTANNNICGVGIAYEAKVTGIRVICDRGISQFLLARALVHNLDSIHIYVNSWTSADNPSKVAVLDTSVGDAYVRGVTEGRGNKGAIYVNGAGDGASTGNTCATDCNVNVPEIITIGAVNQFGKRSGMSEHCTAVFAVTYSGSKYTEGVVTLDENGRCKTHFTGTAAASSIASGIIALTLQANPQLTYRDVMHIIAMSAEVAPLAGNYRAWYRNGRGIWVSNSFGFGLMNAENMVRLALAKWQTVPEKHTCFLEIQLDPFQEISRGKTVTIEFETDGCADSQKNSVRYLEHIEIASVVSFQRRGDLTLTVISPAGTKSEILERREMDTYEGGLEGGSIMSVHNWGEDPRGKWFIEVAVDHSSTNTEVGYVAHFAVKLHGTYDMPNHYKTHRVYSSFLTADGKSNVVS